MASASSQELAALLAENAAWMRRIAAALVGASSADDLVQDTAVAALAQPPSTGRPLRPWLRGVMKNKARMTHRSRLRRERHEATAAGSASVAGVDDHLARLEIHGQVVEAVLGLAEPYRETLVMRFVDDLAAADIARARGIPAATVRSRIKRGLAELRGELDRKTEPASWRAALAPLASGPPAGVAAEVSILGGIVMKIAVAVAGVAIVAGVATVVVAKRMSTPGDDDAGEDSRLAELSRDIDGLPRRAAAAPDPAIAIATGRSSPRRFENQRARERFSESLAQARRGQLERPRKTYDFAEVDPGAVTRPIRKTPGQLDKNYIKDRIAEISPLLRECYELAQDKHPDLAGTVVVRFVVDAEEEVGGYVREAEIHEDSGLSDPLLSECITETILSVEFVAPEGGGEVVVRLPITFAIAGDDD